MDNTELSKVKVVITPAPSEAPPGQLALAELHFIGGLLDGMKLIGFGVWERRGNTGKNVTFPARQYVVNGERRSFALLRPILEVGRQSQIRDRIIEAYEATKEK